MNEYRLPSARFLWQFVNKNIGVLKARLGLSKRVVILAAPEENQTVSVTITVPETIIKFSGAVPETFTLNVDAPNSNIGDKLYVILTAATGSEITATGNLFFNPCGSNDNPITLNGTQTVIVPCVFDGTNFYGLEYC